MSHQYVRIKFSSHHWLLWLGFVWLKILLLLFLKGPSKLYVKVSISHLNSKFESEEQCYFDKLKEVGVLRNLRNSQVGSHGL